MLCQRIRRRTWIGLVPASLWLIQACSSVKGAEVHIIPEGFVGPVVIIYGISGAAEIGRDENGAFVFRIPKSGRLVSKMEAPPSGRYQKTFLLEAANGTPVRLPYRADPGQLQVFADVIGVTERIDGKIVGALRWQAYVIGIPDQRQNWVSERDRFTDEVIRDLVSRKLEGTGG